MGDQKIRGWDGGKFYQYHPQTLATEDGPIEESPGISCLRFLGHCTLDELQSALIWVETDIFVLPRAKRKRPSNFNKTCPFGKLFLFSLHRQNKVGWWPLVAFRAISIIEKFHAKLIFSLGLQFVVVYFEMVQKKLESKRSFHFGIDVEGKLCFN